MINIIQNPGIWDYTAFYLYGKTASSVLNFYLPESFQQVFNTLNLPFTDLKGFVPEVVAVGFPYPPPTILYFIPLGYFSYNTAFFYWTAFNLISLFGSMFLAFSLFFKKEGLKGILLVLILFCIHSQVVFTLICSQTNFILLFLLLLMKKYSNSRFAGIILVIAFFTKPYMIIFGLFLILTRNWKAIIYFILGAAIISIITMLIIGPDTFFTYFTNNPTLRIPVKVFSEDVNQSLHAVLLRAKIISLETPITYLILTALILAITLLSAFYLLRKKTN